MGGLVKVMVLEYITKVGLSVPLALRHSLCNSQLRKMLLLPFLVIPQDARLKINSLRLNTPHCKCNKDLLEQSSKSVMQKQTWNEDIFLRKQSLSQKGAETLNFSNFCLLPKHLNLLISFNTPSQSRSSHKGIFTHFVKNWQLDKGKSEMHASTESWQLQFFSSVRGSH